MWNSKSCSEIDKICSENCLDIARAFFVCKIGVVPGILNYAEFWRGVYLCNSCAPLAPG